MESAKGLPASTNQPKKPGVHGTCVRPAFIRTSIPLDRVRPAGSFTTEAASDEC